MSVSASRSDRIVGQEPSDQEPAAASSLGVPLEARDTEGSLEPRPASREPVVLRLEELLVDENGEILLSVGDSVETIVLETDAAVRDRGTACPTAIDAEGTSLDYLRFDNGAIVFFPREVDLVVRDPLAS